VNFTPKSHFADKRVYIGCRLIDKGISEIQNTEIMIVEKGHEYNKIELIKLCKGTFVAHLGMAKWHKY
jgi:hypothetical protein